MNEPLLITYIVLAVLIWSWALLDFVKSHFSNGYVRLILLLLILFVPVVGSILYFQLKRYMVVSHRDFNPWF